MFRKSLSSRGYLSNSGMRKTVACYLTALAVFLCCSNSQAIAPTPLPAFSVQGLDGSTVSTSAWSLKGKSLVIYLRGNCQPCTALLGRLRKKDYPQLAGHTTIIVGGVGPADAKALQQLYPDLSAATWYVDPAKTVAGALHLQGAPVILGLQDNVVKWALSGIMQHAAQQKSILNAWCAEVKRQTKGM